MSLVFQNIVPPPPSPPGECVPPGPAFVGGEGGTHSPSGEGGGGSIFWKTRDIGLPSYSNNLSTSPGIHELKTTRYHEVMGEKTMGSGVQDAAGAGWCVHGLCETRGGLRGCSLHRGDGQSSSINLYIFS
jgi:hypothetical protein